MARKQPNFHLSDFLYAILAPPASLVFSVLYPVSVVGREILEDITGPVLFVGNHVNRWDPFILSLIIRKPVHFIASDFIFRKPLLGWLLSSLGAVPKMKFRNDMGSLKKLMAARDAGRHVGLYPEGHVNWTGETLPVVSSTGKLIRLLKLPVVLAKTSGGVISRPRWAGRKLHRGFTVELSVLFSGDEVKKLSTEEIQAALESALYHNEWDYLRKHSVELPPHRRAEFLERSLFCCPDCEKFLVLESHDNDVVCKACNSRLRVGRDGLFENINFRNFHDDMVKWDHWQQGQLINSIKNALRLGIDVFKDESALLSVAIDGIKFVPLSERGLIFSGTSIRSVSDGQVLEMPIAKVSGIAVQDSEDLEFYYDNTLYRIEFSGERFSAFLWYSALHRGQEVQGIAGNEV